ncbi:hypothetical protein M6D81_17285 [Paenibacillus sp. J5C_2022]|uniref:hypothetical protein n=1 Tax=Paenibacillus sp. J5C2022 TaxID=2977129 RepID=UPI0021CEB3AA|nr:hypothetical protein [Paenibacillus sp. J5C2022]MCU6710449.1 hypothetical protein [Paenibacillus sp. J5C2022]
MREAEAALRESGSGAGQELVRDDKDGRSGSGDRKGVIHEANATVNDRVEAEGGDQAPPAGANEKWKQFYAVVRRMTIHMRE